MPADLAARPLQHLAALMRDYPDLGAQVDQFRASKGTTLPDWPDWCLLPMSAWHAIADDGPYRHHASRVAGETGRLAALGAWRYTKGVYVVDRDLRAALEQSDITGDLPADVLTRLPEWCLYVATPGMTVDVGELHGVWVHLERDMHDGRDELRLYLDTDAIQVSIPVHLGGWPLTESLARVVDVVRGMGVDVPREAAGELVSIVTPIVSVLLYLCSEAPEIDDAREPGSSPGHPAPKRTRRGWRLFAPDEATVWTVGAGIGERLRHDRRDWLESGRTVRPHLRRGHWHGYWTGPRDGQRRMVYHWLPPMMVGSEDADNAGPPPRG